jgi:hypothetical protein
MKAILSSVAVAVALIGGVARAQDTNAANPPIADPAAMRAALDKAVAKGEISPGDVAEIAKIIDLLVEERKSGRNQGSASRDRGA